MDKTKAKKQDFLLTYKIIQIMSTETIDKRPGNKVLQDLCDEVFGRGIRGTGTFIHSLYTNKHIMTRISRIDEGLMLRHPKSRLAILLIPFLAKMGEEGM